MKNYFNFLFVTLGVIFTIVIIGAVYLYIVDPFHIKPLIFGTSSGKYVNPGTTGTTTNSGSATTTGISDSQKSALKAIGIDPASITPKMEACFVAKLGANRVAEIKAGASPSAVEIFTAKACL